MKEGRLLKFLCFSAVNIDYRGTQFVLTNREREQIEVFLLNMLLVCTGCHCVSFILSQAMPYC